MKVRFLILVFLFASLMSVGQTYKIKVKVKGLSTNDTLLLAHRFAEKLFADDTAFVDKSGYGLFKGDSLLDEGIYVVLIPRRNRTYFEFLVTGKQEFTIETDTVDYTQNMKITGSPENKKFNEFQKNWIDFQLKAQALEKKSKEVKNNPDSINAIRKEYAELDSGRIVFLKRLYEEAPNSLLGKIVNSMIPIDIPESPYPQNTEKRDSLDRLFKYNYNKDHFFDHIDFSDERLLRTPLIEGKLKEFFSKIVVMHPDSLSKEAIKVCELARANKKVFQYVVVYTTNYFETSQYMGMDRIFVDLAQKYYLSGEAYWADSTILAKVEERVLKLKYNLIGNTAVDIKAETDKGEIVRLHQIPAEFTIVVFWEPDCGHCKKVVPKLYEYYKTAREKGVEVFAVYTQNEEDKWKKFIEEKGLDWINVWDQYNHTNFRIFYDIYSTPVIYVLDKDKKILAKRVDVEQAQKVIEMERKKMDN